MIEKSVANDEHIAKILINILRLSKGLPESYDALFLPIANELGRLLNVSE